MTHTFAFGSASPVTAFTSTPLIANEREVCACGSLDGVGCVLCADTSVPPKNTIAAIDQRLIAPSLSAAHSHSQFHSHPATHPRLCLSTAASHPDSSTPGP